MDFTAYFFHLSLKAFSDSSDFTHPTEFCLQDTPRSSMIAAIYIDHTGNLLDLLAAIRTHTTADSLNILSALLIDHNAACVIPLTAFQRSNHELVAILLDHFLAEDPALRSHQTCVCVSLASLARELRRHI